MPHLYIISCLNVHFQQVDYSVALLIYLPTQIYISFLEQTGKHIWMR